MIYCMSKLNNYKNKPHMIFLNKTTINNDRQNFNFFQRLYFGKNIFNVHYFLRKKRIISEENQKGVYIHESPFENLILYCLFIIIFTIKNHKKYQLKAILIEPSSLNLLGLFFKYFLGMKWIIDIWDIPFRDLRLSKISKLKRKFQVCLFRPVFRRADLYIVSILPEFQLKEFKLPSRKMRCFQNAIFLDEYKKLSDVKLFEHFTLLIQRSQFCKGFGLDLMLEALRLVLSKIDTRLVIVGQIMPDVQNIIDDFSYSDKLKILGFVSHKKFVDLAQKAHVCVIPYPQIDDLEQIQPIKTMEFLALGKAIVATNISGIRKIIGKAGILIDPVTPSNLADAILYLYNNPEERFKLEQKAKIKSRQFNAFFKNAAVFNEIKAII